MKCCPQLVLVGLLARFSHGLVHAPAATAQSQHADDELDAVQRLLLDEEQAGLGSRPTKLSASGDVLVEHAAEAVVAKRELADAEERVANALERQLEAKRELAKLEQGSGKPLLAMLPPSHENEPAVAAKAVQATPAHATQKAIAKLVPARIVPIVRASKASAASRQAKSWKEIYAQSMTPEPTRPASVHAKKKPVAKPAPAHIVPVVHTKVSAASHSASPQKASVSPHGAKVVQAKPSREVADKASTAPVAANVNHKDLTKLIPARIMPNVHASKETVASHGSSAELAASAKKSAVKQSSVPAQKEGVAKPTAAHTMHAVKASKEVVASEDGDADGDADRAASEDEEDRESEDEPTDMPAPQEDSPELDVDANPYSLEPHLANPSAQNLEKKEKPSPVASSPRKASHVSSSVTAVSAAPVAKKASTKPSQAHAADKLPAAPTARKAMVKPSSARAAGGLPVAPAVTKVATKVSSPKAMSKPSQRRAVAATASTAKKPTAKTSLKSASQGLPDVLTARMAQARAHAAHPKPAAPTAQKAVTKPAPARHVPSAQKQAAVTKPPLTHVVTKPAPVHAPTAQKEAAVAKPPLSHMAALREAMRKAHAREAEAKKHAQRQSQIDAVKLLRHLDDNSDGSKDLYDALHIMFVHGGSKRVEAARNMLSKARAGGVQVIDDWLNAQQE